MYVMGQEEADAVARVIESCRLSRYPLGDPDHLGQTLLFESRLAKYADVAHALSVTSGTAALTTALVSLGIGPGDEVVIPGYTFIGSALAVLQVGAIPVIADIDDRLTLCPKRVTQRLTARTKAIMPVHMNGRSCDLTGLLAVAKKHNLYVVEDAAQAIGGTFEGGALGSHGDVGVYSFNYYKAISCGEGGALVTSREDCIERARIFHDGGLSFREGVELGDSQIFAGANYRLNEILAAVLNVQLERLSGILQKLRQQKDMYLQGVDTSSSLRLVASHDVNGDCGSVTHLLCESESMRKALGAYLQAQGIPSICPVDLRKHVYSSWTPVVNQIGAHHESLNPYTSAHNADHNGRCDEHLLPDSLHILGRSMLVYHTFEDEPEDVAGKIETLNAFAR